MDFPKEICAIYRFVNVFVEIVNLETPVRFYVQNKKLVAVEFGKYPKISDCLFSDGITVGGELIYLSATKERPSISLVFQRSWDSQTTYNEPNFLLLENSQLLQKIKILDDQKCKDCKIIWVNYQKPNSLNGFVWVYVEKSDLSREYQFYSFDQNRMTKTVFQFNIPGLKRGFVGLNKQLTSYIEIDGESNTLSVCPFYRLMRFSQYSDFKQDCSNSELKVDLTDNEYIDGLENADSGEMLITILSRQDPLFKRQVWIYPSATMVPVLDFDTYAYAISPVWRYQFKKLIEEQNDLIFEVYSTVSQASYILFNPTENLNHLI